jgi:hypothetical protein
LLVFRVLSERLSLLTPLDIISWLASALQNYTSCKVAKSAMLVNLPCRRITQEDIVGIDVIVDNWLPG